MKKLNILLVSFIIFFVGTIGVNAAVVSQDVESGTGKANDSNISSLTKYTIAPTDDGMCIYSYKTGSKNYFYRLYLYDAAFDLSESIGGNAISNSVTSSNLKFSIINYTHAKECPDLYYYTNGFNMYNPAFYDNIEVQETFKCYISSIKKGQEGHTYLWTKEDLTKGNTDWSLLPADSESECSAKVTERNKERENRISSNIVSCGRGTIKNIPYRMVKIISTVITVIQIGVPILLIIFGMIDFAKGVIAQKDDEITKGRKTFISRLITAILVFFVIFIVKIAVRFVASNESANIISCVDCFISAKCE